MCIIYFSDAAIDMLPNGITTVGKTFRVVCTVIGESFVGWEDVNGQRVTKVPQPDELPEEKYYRLIQGNSHTLVIQNVAVADGGNYTCRGDKTVKEFTLYVECGCFWCSVFTEVHYINYIT